MIPLTMMKSGDRVVVGRIGGADEVKKHLEDLGFVVGLDEPTVELFLQNNLRYKSL